MGGSALRPWFFVAALIVAAAVLGGCAPSAPPLPTAAPNGAAVAPTAAPTRPAPTATQAAPAPTGVPTKPAAPTPTPAPPAAASIQWFGQSTFLLTTSRGTRLLTDPTNASGGYAIQPFQGVDVVTITHEHGDHNNLALAPGNPVVIRGLRDNDWAQVDQTVKDVKVKTVPTYHDNQNGSQRGKNAVFLVEVDGLRIVHLGDLGHVLSQEQVAIMGPVDALLIPVGGFFTIDPVAATKVLEQLSPKAAIPMHYKTPKMNPQWSGGPVDPFLEGKKVEKLTGNKLELSRSRLPATTTVYVLGYES